jgi:hypothetical protein
MSPDETKPKPATTTNPRARMLAKLLLAMVAATAGAAESAPPEPRSKQ